MDKIILPNIKDETFCHVSFIRIVIFKNLVFLLSHDVVCRITSFGTIEFYLYVFFCIRSTCANIFYFRHLDLLPIEAIPHAT